MSHTALALARAALADRPAWLVGGLVRDRALGRSVGEDVDIVIDGDPEQAARALAGQARRQGSPAACFALSEEFGGWRVVARDHSWQVDVEPLRGGSLEADLLLRDFTVNAIAEPVSGGATIDPLGGVQDISAGRLRAAGPAAFEGDPLRVLRLARIAVELGLEPEQSTLHLARTSAPKLRRVAAERVFAELCRILDAPAAVHGLQLLSEIDALAVVLPEVQRLRGVEQSRFHHLDVYEHTMAALEQVIALADDPIGRLPVVGEQVIALLDEPLADGLSRASALRWGALLHDIAKPATRAVREHDGRVSFIGHDVLGAQIAEEILARLRASERLRSHVAGLVHHHLRLGFLVHEPQPLSPRIAFTYLRTAGQVAADVTLLSIADRLATRGEKAQEAIERHLRLAAQMLPQALRWHREGPPRPLLRGDVLAHELGIEPGPQLGSLLEELCEAQYAGEVRDYQQALDYARHLLASR
ncbi:MAG TPA: HDIG domain-containing protein [Solirubrobacteraceae bacterium]|jgi:putative nucleotidyltransferase with HDIG domain|nr:HDIG domain-containing protein [Solirubrobacteraceae bacterium]